MLTVTMTFTEDNVQSILNAVNRYRTDLDGLAPITIEQVKASPKLQAYLANELSSCSDEIVYGSDDACANDWLCDIDDHL